MSSDGRHIDITSKHRKFLEKIKHKVGINNKIGVKYNGQKQKYFHFQIGNKNFYEFLLSVGLTQNKSLTIGALEIPNQYFVDFFRGVIDGDGCIRSWAHPTNKKEQWSLRVYSGSEKFLYWLNSEVVQLLRVFGKIHKSAGNTWVLKYGKMAAKEISTRCYYANCLGLDRKIKLAQECVNSYKGWGTSKTVFN